MDRVYMWSCCTAVPAQSIKAPSRMSLTLPHTKTTAGTKQCRVSTVQLPPSLLPPRRCLLLLERGLRSHARTCSFCGTAHLWNGEKSRPVECWEPPGHRQALCAGFWPTNAHTCRIHAMGGSERLLGSGDQPEDSHRSPGCCANCGLSSSQQASGPVGWEKVEAGARSQEARKPGSQDAREQGKPVSQSHPSCHSSPADTLLFPFYTSLARYQFDLRHSSSTINDRSTFPAKEVGHHNDTWRARVRRSTGRCPSHQSKATVASDPTSSRCWC